MVAAAILVVGLLGGSMVIELPADKKIASLETRVAQSWQQQQQYHENREREEIEWRMRYLTDQINRLMQIPEYLGRPLTPEEQWQLEQLRKEWMILKERQQRRG